LQTLLDYLQNSSPEFRRSPASFLDVQDPDGNTPLITTCIKGHFQVAELLLQRGASVAIQNQKSDGGSALHEAINRRHEHIIALLLRYHADPFVENIKSYTPVDFCCQTRQVDLLRRLECYAPWKGWLELKVPVALTLGLSSEWKRRWVVICHRIPSPFAPPNRRRTHVSLLCYKSTHDTTPDCRVWLDGARAIEVNDNPRARQRTGGRTPSQMELKLHRSHSAPSGCVATGNAREGFSLHFRPDEGTARGCSELRQWGEIVNNRGILPVGAGPVAGGAGGQPPPPQRPATTTTAAAHAPVLLSSSPAGGGGSGPQPEFSPLSQGSSRLSDAELARRLQSEEDERLARELSSNINLPMTTGSSGNIANRPSPSSAQNNSGEINRPISQPSQDVRVLFYPSINFESGATPPQSSRPPRAAAAAADTSSQPPPPNPIFSSSYIDSTSSQTLAPSAPVVSRPSSSQPPASTTAAAAAADSGICCVCLDARATYGFIHSTGVCVDLCVDCATDYLRRGDRKCPVCRQDGEIKKVFIH
jgi:Ankyrin repeats (3 copies)